MTDQATSNDPTLPEQELVLVVTPILRGGKPFKRWAIVSDRAFSKAVQRKDGKWEQVLGEIDR